MPVVCGIHAANTESHALNSSDYTSYGVYEATVERVTLTDYTVRTDYGAVLTIPYSMGWIDGRVDAGDRVALDVSRMSLNENQSIIMRGGDDMSVMFMRDEACVSRFDSRGARVPNGVECHRAFGDTEYKGSILLGGGGTYYVLTGYLACSLLFCRCGWRRWRVLCASTPLSCIVLPCFGEVLTRVRVCAYIRQCRVSFVRYRANKGA